MCNKSCTVGEFKFAEKQNSILKQVGGRPNTPHWQRAWAEGLISVWWRTSKGFLGSPCPDISDEPKESIYQKGRNSHQPSLWQLYNKELPGVT